jgi:arsenite methyltransferase
MDQKEIKEIVREKYGKIAKQKSSCCAPTKSCCGSTDQSGNISKRIGYSDAELKAVPEGANLGLGCGNPLALASLRKGETVLDLGSGGGFDCFLAANQVGKTGKVIGVDMTAEMLDRSRENARKGSYENVEFRLGEIENLPVGDHQVDVIISNCVINLSTNKKRVFEEAFRVLKPGGRLMISDMVVLKELPEFLKNSAEAYVGCLSGALLKDEYIKTLRASGFQDVKIMDETSFPMELIENDPVAKKIIKDLEITSEDIKEVVNSVKSIKVYGVKPDIRP